MQWLRELLLADTDLRIVVSSAWRIFHMDDLRRNLEAGGIDWTIVIGKTPEIWGGHNNHRGVEIHYWLESHPEVTQFVILDDRDDMEPHMDRLVRTTFTRGLQPEHIQKIKELLQ